MEAARAVYDSIDFHKGEWTNDIVDYTESVVDANGYMTAVWQRGERSFTRVHLPPEGIIVPSPAWYHKLGFPLRTVSFKREKDARKLLQDYGLDLQRDPPSHWYPGEVGTVAAVRRGRGTNAGGKFNILAFEPFRETKNVGWRAVEY